MAGPKGAKPPARGKGRPKGCKNRTTALAKEAIEMAFDRLGGVARLVKWAKEDKKNESAFFTIIFPKLLPVQAPRDEGNTDMADLMRKLADKL